MSPPTTTTPARGASFQFDQHAHDARFLETLRATLAGCRDEAAVYSAAVHRVAAAFRAEAACLAAYDPMAATLDILHQARARRTWEMEVLMQAVSEERITWTDEGVAVPILCMGSPSAGGRTRIGQYPWGVLVIARPAADRSDRAAASPDRQLLRAVADCIAAEVERRRVYLLDDVLDGLLRKTKPIDVYTHALRQLRRFIRYDHSASVMTMQQGTPQLTVRVEKVVGPRGETQTLA